MIGGRLQYKNLTKAKICTCTLDLFCFNEGTKIQVFIKMTKRANQGLNSKFILFAALHIILNITTTHIMDLI